MVVNVRVLVNEGGAVVDLVVNDHVKVLLGVVSADLLEGEFLCVGHGYGSKCGCGNRECKSQRLTKPSRLIGE